MVSSQQTFLRSLTGSVHCFDDLALTYIDNLIDNKH